MRYTMNTILLLFAHRKNNGLNFALCYLISHSISSWHSLKVVIILNSDIHVSLLETWNRTVVFTKWDVLSWTLKHKLCSKKKEKLEAKTSWHPTKLVFTSISLYVKWWRMIFFFFIKHFELFLCFFIEKNTLNKM